MYFFRQFNLHSSSSWWQPYIVFFVTSDEEQLHPILEIAKFSNLESHIKKTVGDYVPGSARKRSLY